MGFLPAGPDAQQLRVTRSMQAVGIFGFAH
jgi:hypothetical protein